MTGAFNFIDAFKELTGHGPFPWQQRLFDKWFSCGKLPSAVDIPTGLGKTAVMVIWLLARARDASLPRRLVYVVDRRAVVDQATESAEKLREALQNSENLEPVRQGLGLSKSEKLAISTLRGRHVDNREWMANPAAPAIIVGTVDMIGSRLLFEGYGVSRRMRPYAAGLMGCDSLVLLDEAHLSHPFGCLLQAIEREQRPASSSADGSKTDPGMFSGPAASATLPPPFHVLPLSATMSRDSHDASSSSFGLEDEDWKDETVRERLEANKVLTIENLKKDSKLEKVLVEKAWWLMQSNIETARKVRVLVYCDRREDAEKVAEALEKRAGKEKSKSKVILFVGGRRVHEREKAADKLKTHGLISGGDDTRDTPVFVVATSAGEVGVDLDADHMVCDLVAWERMVQRFGRVNRRGMGKAQVWVIDQRAPEKKEKKSQQDEEGAVRHKVARRLLEALPKDETGGCQASPAALMKLQNDPEFRERIEKASTRPPLRPALTRPLVDAWSMTSLDEHAGRPEVGPWLRGWVEDKPQTIVVWRRYLPVRVRSMAGGIEVRQQSNQKVKAFFKAASPCTEEFLETETYRVSNWLKTRAKKRLKELEEPQMLAEPDDQDSSDGTETSGKSDLLAPMQRDAPVAFLLDRAGRPVDDLSSLSLVKIEDFKKPDLERNLIGRQLVVDARLGGIEEGLLNPKTEGCADTIEDHWRQPEHGDSVIRIRLRTEQERVGELPEARNSNRGTSQSAFPWREMQSLPYRVSAEGEATVELVVEKRRGGNKVGDESSIASNAQRLDEHQKWAAKEAGCIAGTLGLSAEDRAMLVAATRHHDDGKEAQCWQRASNAPSEGGPYAKTEGPFNWRKLHGYRHELKSALDIETNGLDGIDRSDSRFELALHLIAAHHGYARPVIGIGGYDDLPPSAVANRAHKIALRFVWLQKQWGPWGLAWWEALLRAADWSASKANDEKQVTQQRMQVASGQVLQKNHRGPTRRRHIDDRGVNPCRSYQSRPSICLSGVCRSR